MRRDTDYSRCRSHVTTTDTKSVSKHDSEPSDQIITERRDYLTLSALIATVCFLAPLNLPTSFAVSPSIAAGQSTVPPAVCLNSDRAMCPITVNPAGGLANLLFDSSKRRKECTCLAYVGGANCHVCHVTFTASHHHRTNSGEKSALV